MDVLQQRSVEGAEMEAVLSQKQLVSRAASSHKGSIKSSTSNCIVVIPTYNECENITSLIDALRALPEALDILVVDDNSPDGTADLVRKLIRKHEGIYLLQRPQKAGLGTAYREGFTFALLHGWKYICQMDADFSHNPTDITRLIDACRNGADVAVGSRYVKGGRVIGWPWKRWLLSRTANLYAQILTRCPVRDVTGGFKCFTREALQEIDLSCITSEGYIFQVEVNYRAFKKALRIEQLPIRFTERKCGTSKMGANEAREGFSQLINVVFNR